ncbi:Hsp70 family protein [Palleronia caenipelagi]|uniref:Hsp70 family protein n=1 Tax=Palleronia caenipelagi TaxID=2489174 RepID=A0A547PMV4_9RHOB|nr:Hsp70 family protein [Palleronia caenipelagi]TRD15472.1 hypothetical protein FEV53_16285 [Palleronia caenipelagi]
MVSVGIDFGTTNSILAYFEDDRPRVHIPSTGAGAPQIRSAVVLSNQDARATIGSAALLKRRRGGVRLIDRFKLKIGLVSEAEVAAKTFLDTMIDNFKADRGVPDIESLVITVPDQWLREGGQVSYQSLIRICASLRLPIKKVLSEPVSAVSYVSYELAKAGTPFSGHALVYDHGGGTLDLSLVRVDNTQITTIDGGGVGPGETAPGVGGVDYDAAVLAHLKKLGAVARDLDATAQADWLATFEECKISLGGEIDDALTAYLDFERADDLDQPIFDVHGADIRPSTLVTVFDAAIAPPIEKEIAAFRSKHAQIVGHDAVRIVMVGGFSNFCLVRRLVERTFECSGPADPRFQTGLGKTGRSFAVALGACLYAADETRIFESCPVDLAIWMLDENRQRVLVPLLRRGQPISEDGTPHFPDIGIVAPDRAGLHTTRLQLVINHGANEKELTTEFSAADAMPNLDRAARWRIGALVDEKLCAHIVFETDDHERARQKMSIGDLMVRNRNRTKLQ